MSLIIDVSTRSGASSDSMFAKFDLVTISVFLIVARSDLNGTLFGVTARFAILSRVS